MVLIRLTAFLACAITLTGCARPHIEPFTEATLTLRDAIRTAGTGVAETMDDSAHATADPAEQQVILAQLDELKRQWNTRVAVCDAAAAYAIALESTVERGGANRAFARAVFASFEPLMSLHAAGPPVAQIGLVVHDALDGLATARTVADAVGAADPLIAEIAHMLDADFADLAMIERVHALQRGSPTGELIAKTRPAVRAWREAHRMLLDSLRSGRRFDPAALKAHIETLQIALEQLGGAR